MAEDTRLTREELYDRVWTEPVRTVAKEFGISDVGLAKDCKRLKIPLPGRGYWAKKAAGKNAPRIPLPALPPNDAVTPREKLFSPTPLVPAPQPSGPVAEQIAFEADAANIILVSEVLLSPHPLVKATRDAFDEKKKDYANYWRSGRREHLDIDVSKAQLRRALRIMDSLVKAFESRGWQVTLGAGEDRKSYVTILGQRLSFGIRETLRKVLNEPAKPTRLVDGNVYTPFWQSKYHDEPSGRLAFVTRNSWGRSVDKSWVETKTRRLEKRLGDFIVSLVTIAHEELESEKRHAEAERLRLEAELAWQAEDRRRQAEAARGRVLHGQASRWERSRRLREYLKAVRAVAQSQPDALQTNSDFSNWLKWAETYACSLDPLLKPLNDLWKAPRSTDDSEDVVDESM